MAGKKRQIEIRHFSHAHMLRLLESAEDEIIFCGMCQEEIELCVMYSCKMCKYCVHTSCINFPRQIWHPFHPHHSLILHNDTLPGEDLFYSYSCSKSKKSLLAREEENDLLYFSASGRNEDDSSELVHKPLECEYHLELKHAALFPSDKHHNLSVQINHQHPLIVCEKPMEYQYSCSRCDEPFHNDLIYVCLECSCLLHESCIALPNEIKHPFHQEQVLTLLHRDDRGFFQCHLCSNYGYACLYRCLACNISLDVFCTNLMPTINDFAPYQGKQIQLNHPHPLIQCNSIKDFRHPCFGCGLSFDDDSIFICLHCHILLHKPCADMPSEIVHTFHPQHPLRLHIISLTCGWPYCSSTCRGCRKGTGSFVYACQDCEFFLDIKCSVAKFPLVTADVHHHSLAFFNIKTQAFRCNICYSYCDKFYFRCVKCNFNIHAHCHPSLPKTIKHDCHCDPLTLVKTPIRDLPDEDDDEEFYCNACEQLRDLFHPSYYCASCHFVAHVPCVISEIISYIQGEVMDYEGRDGNFCLVTSTNVFIEKDETIAEDPTADSEGAQDSTMDCITHEIDKEIEALQENIDALTTKISLLWQKRDKVRANHGIKIEEL